MTPEVEKFIIQNGAQTFARLLTLVGEEQLTELAMLPRRAIITELVRRNQWTYQKLGDVFGVSRQRIQQIEGEKGHVAGAKRTPYVWEIIRKLEKKGIPPEKHRAWFENQLLREGRTQAEVAKELGFSQAYVSLYCRYLGMDLAWRHGGNRGLYDYEWKWIEDPRPDNA